MCQWVTHGTLVIWKTCSISPHFDVTWVINKYVFWPISSLRRMLPLFCHLSLVQLFANGSPTKNTASDYTIQSKWLLAILYRAVQVLKICYKWFWKCPKETPCFPDEWLLKLRWFRRARHVNCTAEIRTIIVVHKTKPRETTKDTEQQQLLKIKTNYHYTAPTNSNMRFDFDSGLWPSFKWWINSLLTLTSNFEVSTR